ncbi:MAG TPA: bifunctional tetrahydrofolate synthase/dihydrofolate synthase [Ruminococcus sp.]|nr:bifunctional tetrahydrofolate synthase/dihydrofolate synthase [Ruminococcus sp.]
MMNYEQAMQFVEGFSRSGKPVRDLSRIAYLMEQLDKPQEKLRFVHIAGTNGKGSVAEYLTNIMIESGYRTGTFTSPYIRHYTDRIRLNGHDIPQNDLCRICEKVSQHIKGDEGYSQFEITMTIAFLWYIEQKAEIVILETGMGGLLDCTNIIPPPLCSVITSISFDHMAILGNTLEEIATQKAGIIKTSSPVVISPNNQAENILVENATQKGCEVIIPDLSGNFCHIQNVHGLEKSRFTYDGIDYEIKMCGMHQIENAVTALETVNVLRRNEFLIAVSSVQRGLEKTAVAGRIQILSENPLIVLDGGHNRDGISALSYVLEESGISEWVGICGMTHADAVPYAVQTMAKYLDKVYCVDGFTGNAVKSEILCNAFLQYHVSAEIIAIENALLQAKRQGKAIIIFGSLYLASWYLNQEG